MLVLSRKVGEIITVGNSIRITVLSVDRGVVRLGIEAPKSVPVHRKEVYDTIIEANRHAARTEISALKEALSRVSIGAEAKPGDAAQQLSFVDPQKPADSSST